jgi:NAD(P)-dependent dehydrogenase (short-subunit alcohol dehydrogenase family)
MRTALVSGATSGIGRAAALALGDAGWWVLACGRDPERGAEVAAELARRAGGEFGAADLTDDGAAQRLVDRAVDATWSSTAPAPTSSPASRTPTPATTTS